MRSSLFVCLFASASMFACSSADDDGTPGVGGAGTQAGNTPGGVPASGTAGVVTSGSGGFVGGSIGSSTGGVGGGQGGASAGGVPASGGSAGATAGGSAGGSAGSAGSNGACPMIAAEYASELEKQLACNPSAGSQCTNRAEAAPGCECRVFIQPSDPFAIEHLSNLANGWFDADCSMPSCPAMCSAAAAGTCQADSKSPLGGRCITP